MATGRKRSDPRGRVSFWTQAQPPQCGVRSRRPPQAAVTAWRGMEEAAQPVTTDTGPERRLTGETPHVGRGGSPQRPRSGREGGESQRVAVDLPRWACTHAELGAQLASAAAGETRYLGMRRRQACRARPGAMSTAGQGAAGGRTAGARPGAGRARGRDSRRRHCGGWWRSAATPPATPGAAGGPGTRWPGSMPGLRVGGQLPASPVQLVDAPRPLDAAAGASPKIRGGAEAPPLAPLS